MKTAYRDARTRMDEVLARKGLDDLHLEEAQALVDAADSVGGDHLVGLLSHPYWLVRAMSCETLGDAGDLSVSSRLVPLLVDKHATVRSRAREALEMLHGRRLSDAFCEALVAAVAKPQRIPSVDEFDQRVFVSYSRKDSKFVGQLVADLKARDTRVWLDEVEISDDDINEAELVSLIEPGVRGSNHLVVVFSDSSRQSHWVERELRLAMQFRSSSNPIHVVVVDLIGGLPPLLHDYSPLTHIDFSQHSAYSSSFDRLWGALQADADC